MSSIPNFALGARRSLLTPWGAGHVARVRGPLAHSTNPDRTNEARGGGRRSVAVIDGPYDATALSGVLAQMPINLGSGGCGQRPNSACNHGTFVIGLLGGLCPDCQLLHAPIFVDERAPWASVGELARAIIVAVEAGARLINLSLAILGDDAENDRDLAAALDHAEASGAIVVAAAGNQGRPATGQLLSHAVTIPVAAIDATGRLLPDCNFGPLIKQRGVTALGWSVRGHAPGGRAAVMSGTSVATAVATGIIAQVWSARPDASADDLRLAVLKLGPRDLSVPPKLDPDVLIMTLDRMGGLAAAISSGSTNRVSLQGEMTMNFGHDLPRSSNPMLASVSPQAVVPADGSGACSCGVSGGVCTCNGGRRTGFVYAIGTVEAEYPNVAIEREMQVLAHHMGVETEPDMDMPMKPTEDRSWQHAVLTRDRKMTRYLARQLSWRLTIEDLPAFVLNPRDPADFDDLIDCLARPKFPKRDDGKPKKGSKAKPAPLETLFCRPQDLDVIIGVAGSQTPDGTQVIMDQVFTIKPEQLTLPGAGGYFEQLADNHGLTDEDRAYNYLIARYAISPENLEDIKEFELAGVPAVHSRLGGDNRRVVRVIYTFNGKGPSAPAQRRNFVRVDVTDEFPFIVTSWNRYLERGEQS